MPEQKYKVNEQASLGLNLRSAPDPTGDNVIAVLPFGQEVTKLEESDVANWWKVQTMLNGATAEGFVNQKFLTETVAHETHNEVGPVHLPTGNNSVTRQNKLVAFPLTEEPPVKRHESDPSETRVAAIRQLIDWFRVASSPRYLPYGGMTFCNIYAYDYCYMTEAYLPRVWWTQQAIIQLEQGQSVPVKYGVTVNEILANGLNEWFKEWGERFGWRRTVDLTELQAAANEGKVCITVARAKSQFHHGHGHIVAVVPETQPFMAVRQDGQVIQTVQSQAGGHNHPYIVRNWWNDGTYADFGHWIHD
ncbi:MAG TPA: SH3 domain-containing protein [Pyrinomonadaceae bacterium]|nr:SH3 domain-containing protein [Pyrinomonadaceae bacterium]